MPLISNPTINQSPTTDAQSDGTGALSSLDQNPYSLNQYRYPIEGIGSFDVPHHVVFYINLPKSSKYLTSTNQVLSDNSASTQNYDTLANQGGAITPANNSQLASAVVLNSTIAAINGGTDAIIPSAVGGTAAAAVIKSISLRPKLSRISTSIAIYMPDTLLTAYSHDYNTVSATAAYGNIGRYAALGGSLGGVWEALKGAAGTMFKNVKGDTNVAFGNAREAELAASFAESTGQVGEGFTDLTLKSVGKAINPHAEMVFKGTQNRQYTFEFNLQPKSQQEAVAIYNIVKTFKAYSAAEVTTEGNGRYFIPPAQFDIKFYFMNKENPTIAKISTCVLNNAQVNYSGSGAWTSFYDGTPLHITLSLQFTEVDIITRELISQYGY